MPATSAYVDAVRTLLGEFGEQESAHIDEAARYVADSLRAGGRLHVFGSGHSMLAAIESTVRAGGLAPVTLVYDPALSPADPARVSVVERLPGYGQAVIELSSVGRGEVLLVFSHSGINPVPVEVASAAHQRGALVVAITSVAHSQAVTSRHASGERLLDVADVVVDTHAPYGDTTVDVGGVHTGAVSTILACAAVHAITVATVERLSAAGVDAPVLVSQNVDGGDDHNAGLLDPPRH